MKNKQVYVNMTANMAKVSDSLQKLSDTLKNLLDTHCVCWVSTSYDGEPKVYSHKVAWTYMADRYMIVCDTCGKGVRLPSWFTPMGISN